MSPRTPAPLARPGVLGATLASVLLGLWIAAGEVGGLLGQLVDPGGRVFDPAGLSGPLALTARSETTAGWRFLAEAGHPGWLASYGVLAGLVRLVAAALLLRALAGLAALPQPARRRPATGLARAGRFGVLAGVALGVLEAVLVAAGARLPALLPWLTTLCWVGLLLGLVCALVLARPWLGRWLLVAWQAAYTHRYSVLVVLPLAALGVARGPDLLEQVPDIQRAWLDPGGWRDLLASAAVTGLLVVATFVVGRQRTDHLWDRTESARSTRSAPSPRRPLLAVWLLGPVLLVAGAVVVELVGGTVGWSRLAVFSAVPLVVAGASWLLRRTGRATPPPERPTVSVERFRAASWLGDVVPASLVVVTGLGAVRAYTGVLALGQLDGLGVVLLVLGALTLVLVWPVWDAVLARLAARSERRPDDRMMARLTPGRAPRDGTQRAAWLSLAAGIVAVVVVSLFPVPLASGLGVIATFQLAVGALSLLIASVVILFQAGGAPEVFWLVRLRFVPVTTLVVATSAVAGLSAGAQVHAVRTLDTPVPERPAVSDLFGDWLAGTSGCGTPTQVDGRTLELRALPLYAAEGGGIRAAYWTTAAIDRLAASADAAGRPGCSGAFLSSGASGGSVGLAVASTAPAGQAADATEDIAGPEALGAASVGLVLRDTIYAATGVPVPSLGSDRPAGAWQDRATLIEEAWSDPLPDLDDDYVRDRGDWAAWGPTGGLVVNSTSATTACRTLLSQVALVVPEEPAAGDCAPAAGVAASSDLLGCTGQLRTTTAALLTARFPYVTPSGVVRCGPGTGAREAEQQVVDGGYAENTGVGTLVDLAPQLLDLVRAQNACALAGTCEPVLVAPLVVYFDNGTGSDLLARPRGLRLEIAVPPVTLLTAQASLVAARAQLQRAEAAFAPASLVDPTLPGAAAAVAALEDWRGPHATYVAYQATEPEVAAPLGWVLSDASTCTMDRALATGQQSRGFGFGTLEEFSRTALGAPYVGARLRTC